MLTNQSLFDKACDSLRSRGNPYGSQHSRGWGWVNSQNPNDRCAIASFIPGCNTYEIMDNLRKELGVSASVDMFAAHPVIGDIITLFDHYPSVVNSPESLEYSLQNIAQSRDLVYTAPSIMITSTDTVNETV